MQRLKHLLLAVTLLAVFEAGVLFNSNYSAKAMVATDCNIVSVNGTTFMGDFVPADLRAVNGGSTGATAGKLELAQLKVTATGSDEAIRVTAASATAVSFISATNVGLNVESHGTEDGMFIGSTGGHGLVIETDGVNTVAARFFHSDNGAELDLGSKNWGVAVEGGDQGGVQIDGNLPSTTSDAIQLISYGTGKAVNALGQVYVAPTNTDDDAIKLVPNGTGLPLSGLSTIVKNKAFDYPILMQTNARVAVSGITPACQIRLDSGMWAATMNSPSVTDSKGASLVTLTAGELNGNVLFLNCTGGGGAAPYTTVTTLQR